MAGNRGTYADGPLDYHGADVNRDLAAVIAPPQQLALDLAGNANFVVSGFALSVVSGMQVQVAAGVCYANGIRAATAAQTLTLNTTGASPRYTIIRVTVTPNNPNGTDSGTGNNLIADTAAVDFLDGVAAGSPVKPTLTSAYQVQVGSVLLPANTTGLTSGMLNSQDTAPNSQGPLRSLVDLDTRTPVYEGSALYAATGPTPNTGSVNSGTGASTGDGFLTVVSNGSGATDGVYLELLPPASGSNTTKYLTISAYNGTPLSTFRILATQILRAGNIPIPVVVPGTTTAQTIPNGSSWTWTVSFPAGAFASTPNVLAGLSAAGLPGVATGAAWAEATAITANGCNLTAFNYTGGSASFAVSYLASL